MSNITTQRTVHVEPLSASSLDYVFIYSHKYSISEFNLQYPDSTLMGIGYLQGWEYHINALGNSNLRKIYYNNFHPSAQYLMPSSTRPQRVPFTGAFGLIISMPHQEFMRCTKSYGHNYLPTAHTVPFSPQNQRYSWGHCNCVAFIDIRNTCDGGLNLLADEKIEETWFAGLASARLLGVPQAYLHEVMRKARGAIDGFEPIFTLHDQIFLELPQVKSQLVDVDEEAEIQSQEPDIPQRATQITLTRALMIKNLLAKHKSLKAPHLPAPIVPLEVRTQQRHKEQQQRRFIQQAAAAQADFLTQTPKQRQVTASIGKYSNTKIPIPDNQAVEKGNKRPATIQEGAQAKKQKTSQEDEKGELKKRPVGRPPSSLRNQIAH